MSHAFPYYCLYDKEKCDLRQGFEYERVPHLKLENIANDEPLKEETLYAHPLEDKNRLRVAGPFTVETLQSYEPISPQELARQREDVAELGAVQRLSFLNSHIARGEKRG